MDSTPPHKVDTGRWDRRPVAAITLLAAGVCLFSLLFALFPRSGFGVATTANWHDQAEFLKALVDTLSTGSSSMFALGIVGPAYAALSLVLHFVFGVSPAASLVLLSELSLFAAGLLLVAHAFRETRGAPPGGRATMIALAAILLFSSTWPYAADIPWSHFSETALMSGFVLLCAFDVRRRPVAFGLGLLVVLIYQCRSYEGTVLLAGVIATACLHFVFRLRRHSGLNERAAPRRAWLLWVLAGAVCATLAVFRLTAVALPFAQYNGSAGAAKLLPALLPTKFVQLFVDPCFQTICADGPVPHGNLLALGTDNWQLPLSLQLPALVSCGVVVALLLALSRDARRAVTQPHLTVALLTAGGLVLAYTSAAASGSPHLRYGFMRDYLAPMVLLMMVAIGLLSAVWRSGTIRPAGAPAALLVLATIALMMLRPIAGSVLPHFALSRVAYAAHCTDRVCSFSVTANNLKGQPVRIPDDTIYSKSCNGQVELGVADLNAIALERPDCTAITLIPAVTGFYDTPEPTRHIDQPQIP